MKTVLLALISLVGLRSTNAQTLRKDGDHYELTFVSPSPGQVHLSANIFARQVGDTLKVSYPSKVIDPRVNLEVFMRNGQELYRITWSCRIVKALLTDSDYYFDRRGTLLSGQTLAEAKHKVEIELKTSGKVSVMRKALPRGRIPESFIRDSFSGTAAPMYWYIKEFFLVSPK